MTQADSKKIDLILTRIDNLETTMDWRFSESDTKTEVLIHDSEKRMEKRIGESEKRLECRITESEKRMEKRFETRLAQSEKRLGTRITQTEKRLDSRITQTEKRLDNRITQTEKKLDNCVAQLEGRIGETEKLIATTEENTLSTLRGEMHQLGTLMESMNKRLDECVTHAQQYSDDRINLLALEPRIKSLETTTKAHSLQINKLSIDLESLKKSY